MVNNVVEGGCGDIIVDELVDIFIDKLVDILVDELVDINNDVLGDIVDKNGCEKKKKKM